MNETLKFLYDKFYTPPKMIILRQEIEACHQQLVGQLEKPERKLVLQIIDNKDQIAENLSADSFICGFKLAAELNQYKSGLHSWSETGNEGRFYIRQGLFSYSTLIIFSASSSEIFPAKQSSRACVVRSSHT